MGKRIRLVELINNPRLTFNIQKLVDDEIIFVTDPGDGQGGVTKPNWEGDCSVLTLMNLTDEELKLNPWRKEAILRPHHKCIPYVQRQQNQWEEEKYQQVIDSIEDAGKEINNYVV